MHFIEYKITNVNPEIETGSQWAAIITTFANSDFFYILFAMIIVYGNSTITK